MRVATAADGCTLRLAVWHGSGRGHALLLPGRTEFLEKYAATAARLRGLGLSVAALDWRGQGLSERPRSRPMIGHVEDFAAYRADLAALTADPGVASLPGPRLAMAHSMGGAILLDALTRGLPADAAVFSAPMWGIRLPPGGRGLLPPVLHLAAFLGLAHRAVPGQDATPDLLRQGFKGNVLTSDAGEYARLQQAVRAHPQLGLGAPSLGWLRAALALCRRLARTAPPALPVLTLVGSDEAVVCRDAIRAQTARQPDARLVTVAGARHEILIERADLRDRAWAEIGRFMEARLPAAG